MEPDRHSALSWLRQLSQQGLVELSPRTLLDVERVLRLPLARDPEALGAALASLLARDEASWRGIEASFRRWVGVADPGGAEGLGRAHAGAREVATPRVEHAQPGAQMSPSMRPSRARGSRWFLVAIVLLGLVSAALMYGVLKEERVDDPRINGIPARLPDDPLGRDPSKPEAPSINDDVELTRIVAPSEIPQPDSTRTTTVPAPDLDMPVTMAMLVLCSAMLAGAAVRWWTSIEAYREHREAMERIAEDARRRVLSSAERLAELHHVEPAAPLSPARIEDAASLLARSRIEHPGRALDVPRTIACTIEAGSRACPAFLEERRSAPLVVLVDVESGDHPDLHRVDLLLSRWQRGGIAMHRYDFRFRPTTLVPRPQGPTLGLAALASRHEGAPLLVISRWARPEDPDGHVDWPESLAAWSNRAWLDTDPRALDEHPDELQLQRRAIEASGLPRFAFTDRGLTACARTLATGGEHPAPPLEEPLPSVAQIELALREWAACACMVPDPTWAQLDALRRDLRKLRNVLPDASYVHRLIEWLQAEAVALEERGVRARPERIGHGSRLVLGKVQRRGLLRWLRRHAAQDGSTPSLEVQARRLLVEQLRAADVAGDPFGAHKRALEIDVHEAVLDSRKAPELLEKWAHTAVATELRSALEDEHQLQRGDRYAVPQTRGWDERTWRAYESWKSDRAGARLVDVLRPRPWTWLRVGSWAVAAVVVAASYAAWRATWPNEVERTIIARGEVVSIPSTWEVERKEDVQLDMPIENGQFEKSHDEGEKKPIERIKVDSLLEQAKKEVFMNPAAAYGRAKLAYDLDPRSDALSIMGQAACRLKDAEKANWVLRRLKGRSKEIGMLKRFCATKGFRI